MSASHFDGADDSGSSNESSASTCCCVVCGRFITQPCRRSHYKLPPEQEQTRKQRCFSHILCPPVGLLHSSILSILTCGLLYLLLAIVFLDGRLVPPGFMNITVSSHEHEKIFDQPESIFALYVFFICCLLAGWLVSLMNLPPLFGMLLMGFILRNVEVINVIKFINPLWSAYLRQAAFGIVLLQAGLGMDLSVLKSLTGICIRLSLLPCLVEAVTVGMLGSFILGWPFSYSFMLGFVLGAVSPAVVVPLMLWLKTRQLGVANGIPTLVIAASSFDDVVAITAFSVILGVVFSQGSIAVNLIRGPGEVFLGIIYGVLMGVLLKYIPSHLKKENAAIFRFMLMLLFGLVALFGSEAVKLSGAGALGCLMVALVANRGWIETGLKEAQLVANAVNKVWFVAQPFLFGLIAAEINLSTMDYAIIGKGICVLLVGLVTRSIASFIVTMGGGGIYSWRERAFITLAWLPKATVQAALGPRLLDVALQSGSDPTAVKLGTQVLTLAVLSILLTAPLGAIAIVLSAKPLLQSNGNDSSRLSTDMPTNNLRYCDEDTSKADDIVVDNTSDFA